MGIWSAAICVYFLPVLAGREVFFYFDITEINYPYRAFYANELRLGRFPLWCPHLFCGFPLFAESQAGALYPLKMLFYPWMPAWLAFGYDTVFHILFAGVAMYVYLRRRVGATAALAGAAVFGYGGFLPAHVIHTSYLNSMPWIPLGLLALERSWETGRPVVAIAAAVALLMQILAGNMQIAILTFLAFSVLAGYWTTLALLDGRRGAALGVAGTTVGAMLLATALGAVQIVPALQLLDQSPRKSGLSYDELTYGSWHPELLPASVFPHAFGSRGYDTDWIDGLYPYHEMYLYLGIVTLLLACVGATRWRSRWVFSHVVLSAVCLLLLLGRYGVLYDWFAYVPVLRGMRMPVRMSLWLGLTLGVLVAQGVEVLRDPVARLRGPLVAFGSLVLVALVLLVATYRPYWTGDTEKTRVDAQPTNRARERQLVRQVSVDLLSGAVLVGMALTAMGIARRLQRGRRRTANSSRLAGACLASLPLLLIADLFWSQRDLNPTIAHDYWSRPPKLVELVRKESERIRIHSYDWGAPGFPKIGRPHNSPGYMLDLAPFETAAETVPMSVAAAWGIDNLRGHTPIFPSRMQRYFDWDRRTALDVANVRYVASASQLPLGGYPKEMSYPSHVYRNPNTLPRARLVDNVQFVEDLEVAFEVLSHKDFPARERLVLEDPQRAGTTSASEPGPLGTARIKTYEPERVVVEVEATRPCYLFLADTFYPEWEAYLDEAPAKIYPADLTFRAVEVPAGSHRIVFRYRRRAFHLGLTVSAIAAGLLIGFATIFRRRQGGSLRLRGFLPFGKRAAASILMLWVALLIGSILIKHSTWLYLPPPGSDPVFLLHTYQWEVE